MSNKKSKIVITANVKKELKTLRDKTTANSSYCEVIERLLVTEMLEKRTIENLNYIKECNNYSTLSQTVEEMIDELIAYKKKYGEIKQ